MTFHFPNIPESDEQLPDWLSRAMAGPDLGELVSELSVFNNTNGQPGPTLREVVGDQLPEVLAKGLGALGARRLRQLIRHPELLMELQEQVLIEGGEYWRTACRENAVENEALQVGASRLHVFLGREGEPTTIDSKLPLYQRPWFVCVATAAVVLLAALAFDQFRETRRATNLNEPHAEQLPSPSRRDMPEELPVTYADIPSDVWGWSIPDAIPDDISGETYFLVLADLAEEWYDERPEDAPSVARRIIEFRQGCNTLFLAEHKPLMDADRNWLIRSCRDWAVELEKHLAELEDQEKDFRLVRTEMDATVDRFVLRLRKWAPIAKRREARQAG